MCEIFPEVSNCCYFFTLRVGMLFISILAIMSGAMTWAVTEQTTDKASLEHLLPLQTVDTPDEAVKEFGTGVIASICLMSAVFIFTGIVLLLADLSDQEGFIQIFVWVTFLNIVLGFACILGLSIHCMVADECILSDLDWLSGSAFLVAMVIWMFVWLYFISVANSYIIGMGP